MSDQSRPIGEASVKEDPFVQGWVEHRSGKPVGVFRRREPLRADRCLSNGESVEVELYLTVLDYDTIVRHAEASSAVALEVQKELDSLQTQ